MGIPAIKSLGYAYMGTITNGRMIFQANSAQFAQKLTYSYLFEDRNDGSGFGATRAKPGRGVESRYWSFGLRNYQGADFSMDDLIILYDLKTKKV
jgi:glucose/arabinose dehydrogenase